MNTTLKNTKKWYEHIPHAVVIVFIIIVFVTLLSYIIPAGEFKRMLIDGRNRVIPNSYTTIPNTPIGFLDMFKAIPLGFKAAIEVMFVVFAGGIMFGIMERTKAIENVVGTFVRLLGQEKKYLAVVIMTFIYGALGVFVGYEHNIAMVPIAAVVALALGGDLILAAGISVGAITIGFGLSPINPYTVGVGHKIAELPLFSGALLRSILCFSALSFLAYYNVRYLKKITNNPEKSLGNGLNIDGISLSKSIKEYKISTNNWLVISVFVIGLTAILYGVFNLKWYLNEISAVFLMVAITSGIIGRMNTTTFSDTLLKSVSYVAPGAFMVGFATTIKVLLEMGHISDTISFQLSELLKDLPLYLSAVGMAISQSFVNFFIPSGSGQALATLPVMIPSGEVIGLTRQTTILAFQIGDGVSNLINPTLGGLIAMLSMCRVPIDRWFRFIFPVAITIFIFSAITLVIAVLIGYN
ncbi:SLC13 family permease [uncultured Kordia sp.]|uniref:YfcC family protein n=1 Tax=uncultured Kordia sp. TaxID=507699 RepID=UPI00260720CD|nr:SLC13 family permease [uncultured Kordia sp.]